MELTRFTALEKSPRGLIVRLEGLTVDCSVISRIGDLVAQALSRQPVEALLVDTTNMLGYGDNCECGTILVVLSRRLMELNLGIRFAVILPERAQRKVRSMRIDCWRHTALCFTNVIGRSRKSRAGRISTGGR